MPTLIEPAQTADLPAILTLLEESGLPRDGLAAHLSTALVARDAGCVVGCAALELYGDTALLRSVAVAPTQRGAGLGQALTRAALEMARRHGVGTVYLLTTTAGDFFPRYGFHPITRAEVAPAVRQSVEFADACPASALVMALVLE